MIKERKMGGAKSNVAYTRKAQKRSKKLNKLQKSKDIQKAPQAQSHDLQAAGGLLGALGYAISTPRDLD